MDSQSRLVATSIDSSMEVPLQHSDDDDDFWMEYRANIVEHGLHPPATRRSIESVCQTIFTHIAAINSGSQIYIEVWDPPAITENLKNLWFHVCWEGMTRDSAFEQQQLVHLVGAAKNLGSPQNSSGPAVAMSGKRLWTELPELNSVITGMLQGLSQGSYNESPNPADHWRSLHALAARFSTCGVSDLRSCGVWALRHAFEDEEDSRVPMLTRLEVAEIWLNSHGFWLESMACYTKIASRAYRLDREGTVARWEPSSSDPVPPGQLAARAGIVGDGVSWERWQFWRSRLSTMLTDVDEDGQPSKISAKAHILMHRLAFD